MTYHGSIGISHLAYQLPGGPIALEDLESRAQLTSPASLLREFGFNRCYAAGEGAQWGALAVACAQKVMRQAGLCPADLEALCVYSANAPDSAGGGEQQPGREGELAPFRYPAARLHFELGLGDVPLLGFAQRGCCGLLAMIDVATRLLQGTEKRAMLCVAQDRLPPGSRREIMYNVVSDAAGALVLEKESPRNRLITFHQRIQTYYWDTPRREEELLAAYFPMAQRVIDECLHLSNLTVEQIAWFVPTNVSERSWAILAEILSVPPGRIWLRNIPRIGHTISCDQIINLADMEEQGAVSSGDYLLLFTFGFGASWSCLILQH